VSGRLDRRLSGLGRGDEEHRRIVGNQVKRTTVDGRFEVRARLT
jgi:hypothetical protein